MEALEIHRHLVRVTLGRAARIELAWTLTDPRVAEVELIADPDYFPEALLVWSKEPEASAGTGPLAALENQLTFPFTLRETPLRLIAQPDTKSVTAAATPPRIDSDNDPGKSFGIPVLTVSKALGVRSMTSSTILAIPGKPHAFPVSIQ